MRDEDIHIGDVLYIREWDEMLSEGHLDDLGNIEIPNNSGDDFVVFSKEEISRCGSEFTVKKIHKRPWGLLYESEEDHVRGAFAVQLTTKPSHFETATDDEIRLLLS